jgi:hypothetical protein
MSITSKEIKELIQAEDDFGHEMRVGNILKGSPIRAGGQEIKRYRPRFSSSGFQTERGLQ